MASRQSDDPREAAYQRGYHAGRQDMKEALVRVKIELRATTAAGDAEAVIDAALKDA